MFLIFLSSFYTGLYIVYVMPTTHSCNYVLTNPAYRAFYNLREPFKSLAKTHSNAVILSLSNDDFIICSFIVVGVSFVFVSNLSMSSSSSTQHL